MEGVGDDNRSSIEELVDYLSQHFYEAELSLALFTAAVTSYRCDSLLKPFPPMYIVDGEPDISALAADVKSIPCLKQLAAGKLSISSQLADLLLWVVKYRKTKLKHLPSSSFEELTKQTGKYLPMGNPQHLYELQFNEQSEAAFTNLAADRKVFCAFHGSRLENFFSILHHGLCGHMNKTSLFGEGTYLSTEPSVAANFSPWGHTGRSATQSVFGHSMSVLALCEVIDDPSVKHSFDSEKVDRKAPNSMGGDVPDKYVVVTNNDMLRVKYLLVYSEG
ncbi:PARP16 [Bugula neritina]|uniref:Poly [ADP-ribose] polymerase n=1 Tax=Bugula neritina TaxID=10212 RepID=A0A7J7KPY0_BUGNE|nr:PARP16 [Bugula neritina]